MARLKKISQLNPKIKYAPSTKKDDETSDAEAESGLEFEDESSQDEQEEAPQVVVNRTKHENNNHNSTTNQSITRTIQYDDEDEEEEVHFDGDRRRTSRGGGVDDGNVPIPSYYEIDDKFKQALASANGGVSSDDDDSNSDREGGGNADDESGAVRRSDSRRRRSGPSIREQMQQKFLSRLNRKKTKFDNDMKPMLESMRNGLGTLEGKIFYHSSDCVMRLHGLKEAVQSDESLERSVWKQLAEWKIVQNELMNIVACNRRYSHDHNNEELLYAAVSLMVTMTQPPKHLSDLVPHKKVSKKQEMFHLRDQYRILQEMKLGFLLRNSISSLMETLIPGDDKALDNNFLLETKQSSSLLSYEEYTMLVIQLLVNLLKIPDAKSNVLSSNDQISQMHELMIKQMDETKMFKFINALIQKLFIKYDSKVSRNNFTRSKIVEWYFQCLQFLCLVIHSETPETLFAAEKALSRVSNPRPGNNISSSGTAARSSSVAPKASDHDQALLRKLLSAQLDQEESQKASISSRHSRFGTYFITPLSQSKKAQESGDDDDEDGNQAPSDNPMKEVKKMLKPNTVQVVRQVFTAKNPLLGDDAVNIRQLCIREKIRDPIYSSLNIRTQKILKDFLFVFYKHSFNSFFERIWESILYQRESILTQEATDNANHEANFLFLGAFMLDFNRHSYEHHKELNQRLSTVYVREVTFDISSIAAVIELPELIQYLFDRVVPFAYETKDWNTLTQSSYFLKEFILCLHIMFQQKGNKRDYVQIASAMLHKILYEPKRIECIPRMVRLFEPAYLPRHYLTNMVELIHYLLQILQRNEEEQYETFYTKKQTKKKKASEQNGTGGGDDNDNNDTNPVIPVQEDEKPEQYDTQIEFDLERFKQKFASTPSIRPYLLLLEDHILNSPEINSHILDMIQMVSEECDCKILFFNVLTLAFFSKVLSKKNDLYPADKADVQMSERERTNKRMVQMILGLIRDWRAMLLNDTVFGKHHHVEAWFLKTKRGVAILKGEDSDVEEDVYSDSERRSRRQNRRKQGLTSPVFSDNEDMGQTSAGEDAGPVYRIRMARDLQMDPVLAAATGRSVISTEDGEEEYDFESQAEEQEQEQDEDEAPREVAVRRKRKKQSSSSSSTTASSSNTAANNDTDAEEQEEPPSNPSKKRKVVPSSRAQSDSDNDEEDESTQQPAQRAPARRRKRKTAPVTNQQVPGDSMEIETQREEATYDEE